MEQQFIRIVAFIIGVFGFVSLIEAQEDRGRVRDNFQSLFDSIARRDRSEVYRKILNEGVKNETMAFDAVKNELQIARYRNSTGQRNLHGRSYYRRNIGAKKRKTENDDQDISPTPLDADQHAQSEKQCEALPNLSLPDFKSLIERKCYIDKTEYLHKMIQTKGKFNFLARPRRMGKTLLVSMMQEFFKSSGDKSLFKETKIYKLRPGRWSRYPVIRLDFSKGIDADTSAEFTQDLLAKLEAIAEKFHVLLKPQNCSTAAVLDRLIDLVSEKSRSKKIVVLVDEYDSPYTKVLDGKNMVQAGKILKTLQSFYSTLKGKHEQIAFCFVTGVTRIALSNFFSGFNAAVDYTMNPKYAGIVGFTDNELRTYFGNQIKRVSTMSGKSEATIHSELKAWHNGFQFTQKCETLYSPVAVIDYLRTDGTSVTSWSGTGGSSRFFVEKLKEFPKEALNFIVSHLCDDTKEATGISASRQELTGKIDFMEHDVRALTALLFHNGYFSVRKYNALTDTFSLNFTNKELRKDFMTRLGQGLYEEYGNERLIKKVEAIRKALDAHEWKSFCANLDIYNAEIPYQITVNQRKSLEAWFQINLFLVLTFAGYRQVRMEESTNFGRIDIVFSNDQAVFIFEPKMEQNRENPVFECKEKYLAKYLLDEQEHVFCIGLKFTPNGKVHSWGVATFSQNGALIGEEGPITLTNHLSSKERQGITDKMKNYKMANPECMLEPEKLANFVEQLGPTTDGQLLFAERFFQQDVPIETLRPVLEAIESEIVTPNIKGILFTFMQKIKERVEDREIQKPSMNSDDKYQLMFYSKLLEPARVLFEDEKNQFPIDFSTFVKFIQRCTDSNDAPTYISQYTKDIRNIITLLEKAHPLIEEPVLKARITRIGTALKKVL